MLTERQRHYLIFHLLIEALKADLTRELLELFSFPLASSILLAFLILSLQLSNQGQRLLLLFVKIKLLLGKLLG